jgi:hypothetical protein
MIKNILFCLSLITLHGCGPYIPSFDIKVDAIKSENASKKKQYVLSPADGKTFDLQFMEFEKYIDIVLQESGFIKVSDIGKANTMIVLRYGSDRSTYQYNYSRPVFGQTGVSSSNSYGTVSACSNTATYSNQTTYTPSYGVIGYSNGVRTAENFFCYLLLDAFDVSKGVGNGSYESLWTVKVYNKNDFCGDLRRLFPVMLAAAQPYIADSTGKEVCLELKETDERVQKLKDATLETTSPNLLSSKPCSS